MNSKTEQPDARPDAYGQARRMCEKYVERGPYFFYPDAVRVENVIRGLAKNKEERGRFYCPCMPIEESLQKGGHNVCPCTAHHDDIARDGHCECALFVSAEFLERERREGKG